MSKLDDFQAHMERLKRSVGSVESLGDWIGACKRLNVPHIPIELVGACWAGEIIAAAWGDQGAPMANLTALLPIKSEPMHRWDCCASIDLKYQMGKYGRITDAEGYRVHPDDPRLCEILEDWPPFRAVRLWKRPWIPARYHGEWPVEFRVFVDDGKVVGASNYYPQRDLPTEYESKAREAMSLTEQMLECADAFTNDWLMRDDDGSLIFLEGGPPHRIDGGAHMCCFKPNEIEGIALSDRNENHEK